MYQRASKGWIKHLDFIILDIVCLVISLITAYLMRYGLYNSSMLDIYEHLAVVVLVLEVMVITVFNSMKNVLKRGYYQEFLMTLRHVGLIILLTTFYLFSTHTGETISRFVVVYMAMVYIMISYITRILLKYHLRLRMENRGKGRKSLLIVTNSKLALSTIDNMRKNNYELFNLAGIAILDKDMTGSEIDGVPVVACKGSDFKCIAHEWVDEVFINMSQGDKFQSDMINKFVEMGITVHTPITNSGEFEGKSQCVEKFGCYTVLTTSINMATVWQAIAKRTLDIIGGLFGCLVMGIILLFLAPAIYIKSPGPVFFTQTRVGKNGKLFRIYKFRSMYIDAEENKQELMAKNQCSDGMMFKIEYDPRIIGCRAPSNGKKGKKGLGGWIRMLSLDEFPQFINVLKGDMSLVGTRPPTMDEWNKYELHHRARLAVKPGLTGIWQVSGRSKITDFEEVVKLDTQYIENWNMGKDIKILLRTIWVVLMRVGAA